MFNSISLVAHRVLSNNTTQHILTYIAVSSL